MRTTSLSITAIVPRMTSEARTALETADIIIGVDERSQREFTVFGMPPLESTTSLKVLSAMQVVRILLDCDKQHLEQIAKLVRSIKNLDAQPSGAETQPATTK